MSLTDLTWLATACYAIHILEEYQLDWRDWARAVIKLPVEWSDFYVTNALSWFWASPPPTSPPRRRAWRSPSPP